MTVEMSEGKNTTKHSKTRSRDHPKPPQSYIALIATAILNSPKKRLTLSEISDYLVQKYEFFRGSYQGWKNSVRHNLSFNKCFVKILRDPSRPWGKDNYWTVAWDLLDDYLRDDGKFRRRRRRRSQTKRNLPCKEIPRLEEQRKVPGGPDLLHRQQFTSVGERGAKISGVEQATCFSIENILGSGPRDIKVAPTYINHLTEGTPSGYLTGKERKTSFP